MYCLILRYFSHFIILFNISNKVVEIKGALFSVIVIQFLVSTQYKVKLIVKRKQDTIYFNTKVVYTVCDTLQCPMSASSRG